MLTPYLIGTLLLILIPAIITVGMVFTEYDGLTAPRWNGLDNFPLVFNDPLFPIALRNSLTFIALAVPLRLVATLGLALLLSRPRRGIQFYRVSVFLPTIIPDVAYALIWLWIFNPVYGPLNHLLAVFGIAGPAWLAQQETALLALALMAGFTIGEGFVVLLAGLQDIPQDYYDAAAVDGANGWQRFRTITFPLIRPWLILLTFRDIILNMQNTFTPAYLMTGGGPYYATLTMPLLVFEEAFDRFRFGHGAVMMLLLFIGVGGLLLVIYRLVKGWGYVDEV